ncbi:hypothetical protein GW813_02755 [bacterium]|nr:hypothetical protein [bacterium]PJA75902.1 MAG: hypothetical protein CO151_04355 [bacterium CG_4_9_14_3_um_filter_65_15]
MTAGDPHDGATGSDPAAEVLKLLGLARRAGKLEVGFSAVERMAHRRSDALVMVARDMGPSQRRQVDGWPGVKVLTLPLDSSRLGEAMGRDKVAVTGLYDSGFRAGIMKLGLEA